MNYARNQPLFFQKEPTEYHSAPNATFLRDLGVVDFEPVCEIERDGQPWIVRYAEIKSQEEYQKATREKWVEQIEAAKTAALPKTTKIAIAAKLGISPSTLRKRLKFIEEGK